MSDWGLYQKPIKLPRLKSASYVRKICFRFDNGHNILKSIGNPFFVFVKQEEVFTFGVISAFPGCILGSFLQVKPGRFAIRHTGTYRLTRLWELDCSAAVMISKSETIMF